MKAIFWALLFTGLSVHAALDDGLIMYLSLDSESGGVTEDSSGQGNHGYVMGATHTVNGRRGGCFHFDGLSNEIVVSNSITLNPSETFSVSAWMYNEGPGTGNGIVMLKGSPPQQGDAQYGLVFFPPANEGEGQASFSLNTSAGSWSDYISPTPLPTGTWIHLAGTYKSGELRVYVNGELSLVRTDVSGTIPAMTGNLTLGSEHSWVDEYFKGYIDEVRIYNRVLSPQEVEDLANPDVPVTGQLALAPAFVLLSADAAEGRQIDVQASLAWSATATAPWLEVTAGSSGTTNGTVVFNAMENATTLPRGGSIVVAGEGLSRTCFVSQAAGQIRDGVVINEIHYHPENDAEDLEYVELLNRSQSDVDLSGWRFSEGIAFTFPAGTILPADACLVVSRNVAALQAAYGDQFPVVGVYTGSLDNAGGALVLVNDAGVEIDRVRYSDGSHNPGIDEWPFEADGSGVSLELWPGVHDNGSPSSWGIGQPRSPGTANHPLMGICQSIVINEIQYSPQREEPRMKFDAINNGPYMEDGDDEEGEYVELFNRSGRPIDLSGWRFTSGISNVIPAGTSIAAGGYLVVAKSPAVLTARHGITNVTGPFSGSLANSGERITLCHPAGYLADTVTYQDQHPWPLAPDDLSFALECFNPWADNSQARNWRAAIQPLPLDPGAPTAPPVGGFLGNGTPGARNSASSSWHDQLAALDREEQLTCLPASIESLGHTPVAPRSSDSVAITAKITTPTNPLEVWLNVAYGASPAETSIRMYDDGQHADGAAGDGTYGTLLAPMPSKTFVHYRVRVWDPYRGITTFFPFENDPSPTQAYFVFDDEGVSGLKQFHLFISTKNWNTFLQGAGSGSEDLDYVDCSVAIDQVAYPHIGIRPRGRGTQNTPPYPIKFRFNKNQLWNGNRTFDTMFQEPFKSEVAARIYRTLGLNELETTLVRVDRNGEYHGTYIGYEAPTDTWLKKHNHPETTEVYKARSCESMYLDPYVNKNSDLYRNQLVTDMDYWGAYNKRIRSLEPPTHIRAYVDALDLLQGSDLLSWLDTSVDLENWMLRWGGTIFMTIDDFTTHNRYEFLPGGGKWSWLGYDYDSMQRGPPLRLFYGDSRGGEDQAWQWNRMCDIISDNPTLRRMYLLAVRRMLADHPADSLFPIVDTLWSQLEPDRNQGHIEGDPDRLKEALLEQQALMLQELQGDNLPEASLIPQISPPGKTNAGPVQVTLSAPAGWDIFVTTNGTDPRLSTTRWIYLAPFQIAADAVVQAALLESGTLPQDGKWTDLNRAEFRILPVLARTNLHFWGFSSAVSFLLPEHSIGGGTLELTPGPTTQMVFNDASQGFDTSHLRVNNPLGAQMILVLPTVGYEDIQLEFLTRRSGQGAGIQTLSYTTNGTHWAELATYPVLDAVPQSQSFDFSSVAGVADNPAFAVRIAFTQGAGGTSGNNRFDDVRLNGREKPAIEPPLFIQYFAPGVGGDEHDRVVIRWSCDPGQRYELQWSDDLLLGFYPIATDLLAETSVLTYTNYTYGAPIGFCRIVLLPQE